ncbi:MAG: nucleotidyltransferase family protein [Spirochaetales bacterium]|nr:nucleotidyltransferase family protein [Spirochaetales bacterium]
MTAIILAAGYATRMYPLTLNFPKPLLEVGEKKIIDHLLDDLVQSGVERTVVVSNHKFIDQFTSWADTRENVIVLDDGSVDNDHRLGAVKDIEFAIEEANIDDDIVVLAGDNVLNFSLSSFIKYGKEKKTTCIMRHEQRDINKLRKTGVIVIDDNDLVLEMDEKPQEPKSIWAVPPFYYYTKEDIKLVKEGIESGCGTDAPGSFISWLVKKKSVHAFSMPGERYDVGSIEGYEKIKKEYKGITIR